MKNFKQILFALSLLLAATMHPAMAGELEGAATTGKLRT